MSRNNRRHIAAIAADVVAEATATVEGRLRPRRGSDGAVPPSVWVNELAHASCEDLEALAGLQPPYVAWEGAISYVASEICARARTVDGLMQLQRNALIPLELDLLSRNVAMPVDPLGLVAMVTSVLDGYPWTSSAPASRPDARGHRPGSRASPRRRTNDPNLFRPQIGGGVPPPG
jgi:hypothetical protein